MAKATASNGAGASGRKPPGSGVEASASGVAGARAERYTDPDGRNFLVHLPPGCDDPSKGHIVGPPIFDPAELFDGDAEKVLAAFCVRLGNELHARGILTEQDARKRPGDLNDAVRYAGASLVSVARIVEVFANGNGG